MGRCEISTRPDKTSFDVSRSAKPAHKQGVKSLTVGSRTLFYGKNDPFRSWPISANELEEVAMGSEANV